jgi:hypothetical protein
VPLQHPEHAQPPANDIPEYPAIPLAAAAIQHSLHSIQVARVGQDMLLEGLPLHLFHASLQIPTMLSPPMSLTPDTISENVGQKKKKCHQLKIPTLPSTKVTPFPIY